MATPTTANDNTADVAAFQKYEVPLKDRLSLSPLEASALTGIGLSSIKNATYRGSLVARKLGRNTIILPSDLQAWLEAMPFIDRYAINNEA